MIRRQASAASQIEYLYQSHTVGRASSCDLVISRRAVSGHHATIRWSKGTWTVRDLGSRNGTFLNQRRIGGGALDLPQPLAVGDLLTFAESDEVWEFTDASDPRPLLIALDPGGPPIELEGQDVLALPSAEEPLLAIYLRNGQWQLERGGECAQIEDKQELGIGERRFRLLLTGALEATTDAQSMPVVRRVEDLLLEIQVSRDEESAAVRVQLGAEIHELPRRTYLYLLAFLARRCIAEAESLGPDAGWMEVESACRELDLASPEALGLLVHRCRKAIKACGLEDPAAIVDRARKGQIRLGVTPEQLSVTVLD